MPRASPSSCTVTSTRGGGRMPLQSGGGANSVWLALEPDLGLGVNEADRPVHPDGDIGRVGGHDQHGRVQVVQPMLSGTPDQSAAKTLASPLRMRLHVLIPGDA